MKNRIIAKCKLFRDREWDQWIVKCWDQDGKRFEEADYFTDDKDDAEGTMKLMLNGRN